MDNNIYDYSNTQIASNDNFQEKVIGAWKYFGLTLLYSIPIIGLLVCIIVSCTAKNKHMKNHARGMVIWLVMLLLVSGIFTAVVVVKVVSFVKTTINEVQQYIETVEDINELIGFFNDAEQSEGMPDLSGLMEDYESGNYEDIMDSFNSENLDGLLNEFQNGDMDGLLEGLQEEDLTELLEQFDTNDLESLINQFGIE